VTDQAGKVQIYKNGLLQGTFIDLTGRMVALNPGYDERGFLGFAFDPNFNAVGSPGFHKVYTYNSEPAGSGTADFTVPNTAAMNCQNVVAEWTVNPDLSTVDMTTRREIMRIDKPQSNHNGGPFQFGP